MITCSSPCGCETDVLIGVSEADDRRTVARFDVPCPLCGTAVAFTVMGAAPDQAPKVVGYERAERDRAVRPEGPGRPHGRLPQDQGPIPAPGSSRQVP